MPSAPVKSLNKQTAFNGIMDISRRNNELMAGLALALAIVANLDNFKCLAIFFSIWLQNFGIKLTMEIKLAIYFSIWLQNWLHLLNVQS